MFTEVARKYLRILYEPPARFFSILGVSPNVLTVVGFLLMVGIALVLAQGYLFLGGLLIIIAGLFDAIDGSLARMLGQTDRFSEAVIFLGLFIYLSGQDQRLELILIYATTVGSLMVSYARARAEGIGISLKDGLFTRFERVFLLVVGLLFNQLTIVLWILAIFSNFTAIQRMYLVWRLIGGEEGG
jgi:CDP-diacylglycerol--glycerol-3-phosphate 3-phosphatidyltransferase